MQKEVFMVQRRRFLCAASCAIALPAVLAVPALGGGHVRSGSFSGRSGHKVSGRVEVSDGQVRLLDDFLFDGAPDPRVTLGYDGSYAPETTMGVLESNQGASTYTIVKDIDPADYDEVWLWCERFSAPLGVAKLQ